MLSLHSFFRLDKLVPELLPTFYRTKLHFSALYRNLKQSNKLAIYRLFARLTEKDFTLDEESRASKRSILYQLL